MAASDRAVIEYVVGERLYDVQPSGEVRRWQMGGRFLPTTPLTPYYNGRSSLRVKLKGPDGRYSNVLLHRLVYYACTHDDRMWDGEVVHLDGDYRHNDIDNLRLKGCEDEPLPLTRALVEAQDMQDRRRLAAEGRSLEDKQAALRQLIGAWDE